MKKFKKIRNLVLGVFLLSLMGSYAQAQCTLKADKITACRGSSINFSIPATTTFSSIKWSFGNGDSSVQPTSTVNYIYDTFGTFNACVTLFNSDGSIKCGPSCLTITIYDNPKADLILPLEKIMCFEQNSFCFKDNSLPGVFNSAPIQTYLWDFGSGDSSTTQHPCWSYTHDGTYTIILTVTDTNGCWDTSMKTTSITVLPKLNPKFETHFQIGCPETPVTFKNTMDTVGKCITEWTWDFGDGTVITSDSDTLWGKPSFVHIYKKDGTFNPTLTVRTCHGCVDSLKKFSGAKNIFYYFDIVQKSNPPQCWQDNSLCFAQKPRRNAYYWLWNFDDPPSMLLNTNDEEWEPCHHYTAPGVYHISLKIWEPNCIRDTTFCTYIPLLGPQAMINMPPPPAFPANDQLQAKPIPVSFWHTMSSTCWNPAGDPVDYVIRSAKAPLVIGQVDSFCNSLLDSANFADNYKPHPCPAGSPHLVSRDFPMLSPPISTTYIYDVVVDSTVQTWNPGNNIPPGVQFETVYFPKSGGANIQTMHDTDLFKHDCSGPNYVRFTNNSIKYRWYYAIDDNPLLYFPVFAMRTGAGANPDMKFDNCYNPSYPWASDSMQYLWSFADGDPCTSTEAVPNINCQFSTEIQPWHLYKEDGCYSVTLSVTDTVTNCVSEASVNIVMEAPDAGWEVAKFGMWKKDVPAMDWAKQLSTPPALGRRGVILNGTPCVGINYPQVPSFNETLPSCARQTWWMVFDSVSNGFGGCGTPTAICTDQTKLDIDGDGVRESIENHTQYDCAWVDEITFMMMGNQWIYGDGGWKTIGLIIKTGDCFDTFFYHDYKYIADLNNAFNINDPYNYNAATGKYLPMDYAANQHLRLCPNLQSILTVGDTDQVGIVDFRFFVDKYFPGASPLWPSVHMEDSCQITKPDTIWWMCHKDSFTIDPFNPKKKIYFGCFMYPDFTRNKKVDPIEWADFAARGYFPADTFPQLTLTDSFYMKQDGAPHLTDIEHDWSLNVPGKYRVTSTIKNVYGCATGSAARIVVGHYSNFEADDRIICYEGGGDTVIFTHDVRYFWIKQTPFEPDLNPNEFWVDPANTTGIIGPPTNDAMFGTRAGVPVAPSVPERVEWDFGDGTGWHTNAMLTDTIFWVFNKPGDYTITMRTTDSNGCVQDLERKAYVKVMGVVADFDTINAPAVCAPQPVKFVDLSMSLNNYTYVFDKNGQIIDSTMVDSVVYWTWSFHDDRGSNSISYIKSPTHTYITNGTYDVTLIVRMLNGCVDTITKPAYINITGPQPKFWLYKNGEKRYNDTICAGEFIVVLDSSGSTTDWQFVKGDNTIMADTSRPANHQFAIQYTKPGTYNIYLNATAKVFYPTPPPGYWGDCTANYARTDNPEDTFFTVVVMPVKASAFGGDTILCDGDVATYIDSSAVQFDDIIWNFGDGSGYSAHKQGETVTHIFTTGATSYDTTYSVEIDAKIHPDSLSCPDKIKTLPVRVMKTDAEMAVKDNSMPVFTFENSAKGATHYEWTVTGTSEEGHVFDESYLTQSQDVYVFDFEDYKGEYTVCLWAWIETPGLNGCLDTSCVVINNTFEVSVGFPNIMTPNGDGINDELNFKDPQGTYDVPHGVTFWEVQVFNRWGEKVFESDDPAVHWNGLMTNTGNRCADGTYYWTLNYQLRGEEFKSRSGTVTVLR
ncbi:MAG: PKD domain-containing protein [Bacteroidetes bacterium]|nr:PKD domain-containing protein [Bacteroidota bacterium]